MFEIKVTLIAICTCCLCVLLASKAIKKKTDDKMMRSEYK